MPKAILNSVCQVSLWMICFCTLSTAGYSQDFYAHDEEQIHSPAFFQTQQWQVEKEALINASGIDINTATKAELTQLGLPAEAIESLLTYRTNYGKFTSLTQLQGLEGWDPVMLFNYSNFLFIQTDYVSDLKREILNPKTYFGAISSAISLLNNNPTITSTLRYKQGNRSSPTRLGINLKRTFERSHSELNGSFYIQTKSLLSSKLPKSQLTVGYFRPDMGLGVNLGGNAGFSPWLGLANQLYSRQPQVTPWQSALGIYALKGLAFETTIKDIQTTAWLHYNPKSYNQALDSTNNLPLQGLVNSKSVIQPGFLLNKTFKQGNIYGTYFHNGEEMQTGLGAMHSYRRINQNIELGLVSKSAALLYTVNYTQSDKLQLSTSFRSYGKDWKNPWGNSYSQGYNKAGETGFYTVAQWNKGKGSTYWFTSDYYKTKSANYQVQNAIHVSEVIGYKTNVNFSFQANNLRITKDWISKLAIGYPISDNLKVKLVLAFRTKVGGFSTFFAPEIQYAKGRHKLLFRAASWQADSYFQAVYVQEPDIFYFNRNLAAYETGSRMLLIYNYNFKNGFESVSKLVFNQLFQPAKRQPVLFEIKTGLAFSKR